MRRSYLQFLFQALGLPIRPSYWDAQTKITQDLGPRDQLTLVGLGALDDFTIAPPEGGDFEAQETARRVLDNDQWSYTVGGVWRHLTGGGVIRTALSRSTTDFQFSGSDPDGAPVIRNGSRETETRLRTDADLRLSQRVSLGFGGGLTRASVYTSFFERARPGTSFTEDLAFSSDLGLWRSFAYAQATTRWLGGRLTLAPGARLSATSFLDTSLYLSPRLSASLQLTPQWALNASTGVFQQAPEYISLVVQGDEGDYVNDGLPFIRADHYVAGVEWQPAASVRATLEGFYKDYDRLNAERVPAYHRLDLRVDRRFAFEGWNAVVYVDVQNIYNRTNVFDFEYTEDPSVEGNRRVVENVGLLPNFGFSVEW